MIYKSSKLVAMALFACVFGFSQSQQSNSFKLPLAGNAFSSVPFQETKTITKEGIVNWNNSGEYFTAYFRTPVAGTFELSISKDDYQLEGASGLRFTINNTYKDVRLNGDKKVDLKVGTWTIDKPGYVAVKICSTSKTNDKLPSISNLSIASSVPVEKLNYVRNNDGNFYYWGRRGPSVHLSYDIPKDLKTEWFYNEITVPAEQDVIGSYYMAAGFGEGYFGMQVNSETERRILFSVWSPHNTDDPKSIPDSLKIKLINSGPDVTIGEFGNEGSGGQSYLRYNWKAGNTYKFLLRGKPDKDNYTTYTAYFFAPEENEWRLIACFSRPQTSTYLKRFHSFLENFNPEQGNKTRYVLFGNQWCVDDKGNWKELTSAKFTTDNTGSIGYRQDFSGGAWKEKDFYLKMGGFFNDYTQPQKQFTRKSKSKKPEIDFKKLP